MKKAQSSTKTPELRWKDKKTQDSQGTASVGNASPIALERYLMALLKTGKVFGKHAEKMQSGLENRITI